MEVTFAGIWVDDAVAAGDPPVVRVERVNISLVDTPSDDWSARDAAATAVVAAAAAAARSSSKNGTIFDDTATTRYTATLMTRNGRDAASCTLISCLDDGTYAPLITRKLQVPAASSPDTAAPTPGALFLYMACKVIAEEAIRNKQRALDSAVKARLEELFPHCNDVDCPCTASTGTAVAAAAAAAAAEPAPLLRQRRRVKRRLGRRR